MAGLKKSEILMIVNRYIGVAGGYLGNFSYRTHEDFYPEYCDLDIDPNQYDGTTRERFMTVLSGACPADQAKIIRGVLTRFPMNAEYAPDSRTQQLHDELLNIACRLKSSAVSQIELAVTSAAVEHAIADAEALIREIGPSSAVDRVHTALHGYLAAHCDKYSIVHKQDASITDLFKLIRNEHPALQRKGVRAQEIDQIVRSLAAIIDSLNTIRNKASIAHPNPNLLADAEAHLVINTARTILQYMDAKLSVIQTSGNAR